MLSRDFSGEEVVNLLEKFGDRLDWSRGDHASLNYTPPEAGKKRTVPSHLTTAFESSTLSEGVGEEFTHRPILYLLNR